MFKKKIATLITAGLSVMALYLSLPVRAEKGYDDTSYYFRFENVEPVFTEARKKEDTTSSYIKCTYCSSNGPYFIASVYGMDSREPRYGRYDCSGGHTYAIRPGESCKLVNYVKERGYSYACIKGTPVNNKDYDTYGLWSPDSK